MNISETKAGRIDAVVQVRRSTIQQFRSPISWWFAFLVFMAGCGKSDVIDRIRAGDRIAELHLRGFTSNERPFQITLTDSNALGYLSEKISHSSPGLVEGGKGYTAEIKLVSGVRQGKVLILIEKHATRFSISCGRRDVGPESLLLVNIGDDAPPPLKNLLLSSASN